MKKPIIITFVAAVCAAGVIAGAVVIGNRKVTADIAKNQQELVSELKVGRFYLEGGTDEQFIEVFDDHTICLFGDEPDEDADEVQIRETERFTTRKYYWLNDKLPFIGLSDEPDTETPGAGYTYTGEDVINFTNVIDGEYVFQKYIYR